MGTRADFYIGMNEEMEYIGSTAHDGYPIDEHKNGIPKSVLLAVERDNYIHSIKQHAGDRFIPGWPWSWNTSELTDFAYTLYDGNVWVSRFGSIWIPVKIYIGLSCEEFQDLMSMVLYSKPMTHTQEGEQ